MRSPFAQPVNLLACILTGLIAGLMLGTGMEQHTLVALSPSAWTTEHQTMDALFSRVMPIFWNGTIIVLLVATFLNRGSARWLFGAAAALFLISLLVTVRVEVPMNRQITLWNPSAPPADWAAIRDRWLSFHRVRTVSGIIAFLCSLFGLTRR